MDTEFIAAIFGFLIGIFLSGLIAFGISNSEWRAEANSRGLALYCPDNGEWAWKGECDAQP